MNYEDDEDAYWDWKIQQRERLQDQAVAEYKARRDSRTMNPSNFDKAKNAEVMFGTNSPQHLKMKRALCTCICATGGFCGGCGHAGCGRR